MGASPCALRAAACLLAALIACDEAPARAVEPADPVTFAYYDVRGHDAATIRAAIDRLRPVDPTDRRPYDALTTWRIDWRWDGDGKGGCDLATTRTTFSAVVTFPRLDAAGVPPPILAEWTRYEAALRAHEMAHVRNVLAHLDEVTAAVRSATCDTANARGMAVIDRIRAMDRALDAETGHGLLSGGRFPR